MGIGKDIKQPKFKSEFQKSLINLIFTSNWLSEQQNKIFKPYGLTIPQYNVLRILRGQHPKPATINLIIERMLDRMSNASRLVDKLLAKGMVHRKQNQVDRRSVDVSISEDGLKLLKIIDEEMDELMQNINVFTDAECKAANSFLDRFRGSEPD